MTRIAWPKLLKVTSKVTSSLFCWRAETLISGLTKPSTKLRKLFLALTEMGRLIWVRWKNLYKTCVHLQNVSASFQNVMHYITQAMKYLSPFFIYYKRPIIFLWFDLPWTLNSIMWEKHKKKIEQPESDSNEKRSLRR